MNQLSLQGNRILLVEDVYMIAMSVQLLLEERGCVVVGPCPDTSTALAAIRRTSIDGAVLDIKLKGGESFVVAEALKQRGVPFLFLSGYRDARVPDSLRETICLEKPCSDEELLRAMQKLFKKKR
jgi:DNA-binding response OmpR family regulator